jgi:hypothetical protein
MADKLTGVPKPINLQKFTDDKNFCSIIGRDPQRHKLQVSTSLRSFNHLKAQISPNLPILSPDLFKKDDLTFNHTSQIS